MHRRTAVAGAGTALLLGVGALTLPTGAAVAADTGRGQVRTHRDARGHVDFLARTDGRVLAAAPRGATPAQAVRHQLTRLGPSLGLDGGTSRAVVTSAVPSSTGGTVVRAQQVVDGVPVLGGQVVSSLDEHEGLVSLSAATTAAVDVPAPVVGEAAAVRTARGLVARAHHVDASGLHVDARGRELYDPALLHVPGPATAVPVWHVEVRGAGLRETVLVSTANGHVLLHFEQDPGLLDRTVCDNAGDASIPSDQDVPVCDATAAARTETSGPSGAADVDTAFDNLGEAARAYDDLDGIDLTDLLGVPSAGHPTLMSTVRWCYSDADLACPYDDAFWDGRQMVFGEGFPVADDVVAHELTHGYVERTSNLFPFYQSGAINESVADTIGEIVDHRNGGDDDAAWTIGEDLAASGDVRSMQDPTLHDQPDSTASQQWGSGAFYVDNGEVHLNDGVGNKTAYLISQGGTFRGHTVTGIDAGDPGLAKTGRLYLETIPRLTSGADYTDLGRTLVATCDELAQAGTGGFTDADCTSVTEAVAATGLAAAPDGAPTDVPVACPTGTALADTARFDDDADTFGFTTTSPLWGILDPTNGGPYATSGTDSLFALDPDPSLGDPVSGYTASGPIVVPNAGGGSYFNFQHAELLDYDPYGDYDGGQVVVQQLVGGSWQSVTGLPWVNGPTHQVRGAGSGFTGFGGDSRGYGSSQVDLSGLAGRTIRIVLRIEGDTEYAYAGWWLDDLRLYSCYPPDTAPSAPTATVSAGLTSATVTWTVPGDYGSGVSGYVVTSDRGTGAGTLAATARSATITGLDPRATSTVGVAATGPGGTSPATQVVVRPSGTEALTSVSRMRRGGYLTVTARSRQYGTTVPVPAMPVSLQRRYPGSRTWVTIATGTTGTSGTRAWRFRQYRTAYFRTVSRGHLDRLGSVSTSRGVAVR